MPQSLIAYNLISFSEFSILALTSFANKHQTLDSFTKKYVIPDDLERLFNEIAFFRSEEPIISVRLWQMLDEFSKAEVQRALVHPAYRQLVKPPAIIKLNPKDRLSEVPASMWKRLTEST